MASKNDKNIPEDGSGGLSADQSNDLPMSSPRETELGGGGGSSPSDVPNAGSNPVNIPTGSDLSGTQARDLPMAGPLYTNEGKSWGDELAAPGAVLMLSPGQVLANRYQIKQRIGAGGMGAVFSAHDKVRDEDIAIKVLLPKLLENPAAKERFLNEAKIASNLSHPNIVNVFDIQQDGHFTFITMELLKGGNLRDEIVRRQEKEQRFTIDEVRNIAVQLCDALSHAHKQTVHRDVKPENIWLCQDGTIRLMDFGIARLMRASQFTSTGLSMGTAYYMAPEQLKGAKDIDHRADQYSVGVLLYELLTGEIPQGRFKEPHDIRKSIPLGLSSAVLRTLEGNPTDRYADIAALKKALAGKGSRKSARGSGKPFPKKAAIAALIVILAGLGVMYPQWKTPAYRWYKTATAGEIVSKAEEAKTLAESKFAIWEKTSVGLSESEQPAQITLATAALDRGRSSMASLDFSDARNSFEESARLWDEGFASYETSLSSGYAKRLGEVRLIQKEAESLGSKLAGEARAATSNLEKWEGQHLRAREQDERDYAEGKLQRARKTNAIVEELHGLWQRHPQRESWLIDASGHLAAAEAQSRDRMYAAATVSLGAAQTSYEMLRHWESMARATIATSHRLDAELSSRREALGSSSPEYRLYGRPIKLLKGLGGALLEGDGSSGSAAMAEAGELLKAVDELRQVRSDTLAVGESAKIARAIMELKAQHGEIASGVLRADALATSGAISAARDAYANAAGAYAELEGQARAQSDKLLSGAKQSLSRNDYAAAEQAAVAYLEMFPGNAEGADIRKSARIGRLLATAKANDNEADGERLALPALADLLELDPSHSEALALQEKIRSYYCPRFSERGDGTAVIDLCDGVELELVLIDSGSFMMGSPDSEEKRDSDEDPQHLVRISEPYYLGKYEVTQGQWRAVMGENPSSFDDCGSDCPVENVSWDDCKSFCGKLSERTGLQVRLPTEAEWEYACRAGTTSPFHFGGTISTDLANYDGNYTYGDGREGVYRKTTLSVGSFASNAWGLYDMHGNVREWCSDWYASDYYGRSAGTDPSGPSSGDYRVLRGGSWNYYPRNCRSANRYWVTPDNRLNSSGLRVVVSVGGRSGTP